MHTTKRNQRRTYTAELTLAGLLLFNGGLAIAQTMGEYGTTTANSATTAASAASSLSPPVVHVNPVGGANSTVVIDVANQPRQMDDTYGRRDDDSRDSANGDEWTPSR